MKHVLTALFLFTLFLGCHEGYIALWKTGAAEPEQRYPYRVSSLPPADQTALEQGIPITDPMELAQRLEDFLS